MSHSPSPIISYLGPPGTYAEAAALAYVKLTAPNHSTPPTLAPYPTIAQTLKAASAMQSQWAIVPVENSIEGSVNITLDTLWQLDHLQIQQALVLPISHALISHAQSVATIKTIFSHPQALAQCQEWIEHHLPAVTLIPTNSTAEALQHLENSETTGAIASERAAYLYQVPILAHPINDHPDNCTRFWVVSLTPSPGGSHTSMAFSFPANLPGALAASLNIFARRGINLSRIESRPTKRSLGEYLFFVDIEGDQSTSLVEDALVEIKTCTETLKIFGSYPIVFT